MSDTSIHNYNYGMNDQNYKYNKKPDENNGQYKVSPTESESTLSTTSPASSNSDTSAKDTTLFSENGSPPSKRRRGLRFEPRRMTDTDYSSIVEMMCDIKDGETLNLDSSDEGEQDQDDDESTTTQQTDQTEETGMTDNTDQNEESDLEVTFESQSSSVSDISSQEQVMDMGGSKPKAERVFVHVVTNHRIVHNFQIKITTRMAMLMGAYSLYAGIPMNDFQFFYRGKPVHKNDTAISLGLEWGDFIDSQIEQDYRDNDSQDHE
ncbi:hypothetical protein KR074_002013 [Drosophila pseudoananassae]|nr:hypothetical protein KR074_002013 [Drosophila pseudoananassae]